MTEKNVLIALNAFKQNGSSVELGYALQKGLIEANDELNSTVFPLADGGDGTLEAFQAAFEGEIEDVYTVNAIGEPIKSPVYIFNNGESAFIEMAASSGMKSQNRVDLMNATTYGTGLVVRHAIESGCTNIVIGVGGTDTVDLGLGLLSALGLDVYSDKHEQFIPKTGTLRDISYIDSVNLKKYISDHGVGINVLCDGNAYVTGNDGVWERVIQKGGSIIEKEQIKNTTLKLLPYLEVVSRKSIANIDYLGCGGGTVAGLYAFADANVIPGTDYIMDALDINPHLQQSSLVLTGEGKVDLTTFLGKAPYRLLKRAQQFNKPVVLLTAQSEIDYKTLRKYGFEAIIRTDMGYGEYPFANNEERDNHMQEVGFNLGKLLRL